MTVALGLFTGALILLLWSGSQVVTSLARLATALRLSAFTAGIVIMAFATTGPELLVGVDSALAGEPELSFGNVLGTGVANLGLILGLLIVRAGTIRLTSQIFRRDLILAYALAFLGMFLALDGTVGRLDGGVMLLAFVLWLTHLLHERQAFNADVWNNGPAFWGCLGAAARFGLALLILLLAASWTVDTGLTLARVLSIPAFLIGVLALAVGTSLPELTFVLRAIPVGKTQFAVGDLVGATAVTASLVLGLTAVIAPIAAPPAGLILLTGASLATIAILTLAPLAGGEGRLTRPTGWMLLLVFACFAAGQVIVTLQARSAT